MKQFALLLLALPLASCFSDQKQQLAKCETEVKRTYPKFIDAPNGEPLNSIKLCMKAAGYGWVGFSLQNKQCDQALIMQGLPDDGDSGAHCFRPESAMSEDSN